MITYSELKTNLLDLNIFENNEYLDLYCSLIINNLVTQREKFKTQKHHVIPVCYYRWINNLKTRDESIILANSDPNNFVVNLLFRDHILAHYYLALAVFQNKHLQIKFLMANSCVTMLTRTSSAHQKLDSDVVLNSISEIDLGKYQEIYQTKCQLAHSNGFTAKGRKHTFEWCQRHSEIMTGRPGVFKNQAWRDKIRNTIKQGYAEGKYFISEESKQRKRHPGESNGRYGKSYVSITDGLNQRYIRSTESIPIGWIKGTPKSIELVPIVKYDPYGNPIDYFSSFKQAIKSVGASDLRYMKTVCRKQENILYKDHLWRCYPELIDDKLLQITLNNDPVKAAAYVKEKYFEMYNNKSIEGVKKYNPVQQFDLEGNFISEYIDLQAASKATNIDSRAIMHCCERTYKTSHGFIWRYKQDIDQAKESTSQI